MYLNNIEKLDPALGNYIVLVDYGTEGLCVWKRCNSIEEAVMETLNGSHGGKLSIVSVVYAQLQEGK